MEVGLVVHWWLTGVGGARGSGGGGGGGGWGIVGGVVVG